MFQKAALILLLVCASAVFGVGISITPGTFLLQDVPVGKKYDITATKGFVVRIDRAYSSGVYIIKPVIPSADGTKATGFFDFPGTEFFHFERDTLILSDEIKTQSAMWMHLPDDPSLYNRHFLLGVDVSPTVESTSGMLAVGAYLLFRFETEPKTGVVPKLPSGEAVFVPSVIRFDSLGSEANVSQNLKFFVGSKTARKAKFYRLDPESDVAKLTILPTTGFRRAPEGTVFFPAEIRLDENGAGNFFVQVAFEKKLPFKLLEEIILAELPDGTKAFLRVHLVSAE